MNPTSYEGVLEDNVRLSEGSREVEVHFNLSTPPNPSEQWLKNEALQGNWSQSQDLNPTEM